MVHLSVAQVRVKLGQIMSMYLISERLGDLKNSEENKSDCDQIQNNNKPLRQKK